MENERFEELNLQGRAVKCPTCGYELPLTSEDTVGGGYGVVGIKCSDSKCEAVFAIEVGKKKG